MSDTVEFEDGGSRWVIHPATPEGKPLRMLRVGRGIRHMDRSFDQAFWQAQGGEARASARLEMNDSSGSRTRSRTGSKHSAAGITAPGTGRLAGVIELQQLARPGV